MCGIVGVLTSNTRMNGPLNKFFKQALFADTLRGVDSTGIAVMDLNMDQPETYKKALAAPDFLQLSYTDKLLDDLSSWNIMLGHNRAATRGGIKHQTAHPFQVGAITMVHNGTISNHRQLTGGSQYQVDSEAIASAVDLDGIEEVVKTIDGAFTLVWHDAADKSINIIRNKERPLWIGIEKGGESLIFASEGNMLKWLAGRNGIELESIFQPEVGEHYKYFVGENKDWATAPIIKALPLRPAPVYGTYYGKKSTGTTATTTQPTTVMAGTNQKLVPFKNKPSVIARIILDEMGVKGDEVVFIPTEYKPYAGNHNQKKGIVTGYINENYTNHRVRMYEVPHNEWKDMEGCLCMAQIVSAYKATEVESKGQLVYTIITDPLDYISYDWEGEVTSGTNTTPEQKLGILNYVKGIQDAIEEEEDNLEHLVKGPRGLLISEDTFEEYTKHGCDMCTGNIYLEEAPKVNWTSSDLPVCPLCCEEHDWDY